MAKSETRRQQLVVDLEDAQRLLVMRGTDLLRRGHRQVFILGLFMIQTCVTEEQLHSHTSLRPRHRYGAGDLDCNATLQGQRDIE